MPTIGWLEGLLPLLDAPFPFEDGDPRKFGFQLGRQVIALYTIELALKYELEKHGQAIGTHHNLRVLFQKLPSKRRSLVEKQYTEILKNRVSRTFDIARSIRAFLQYLGSNPITNTRYFWEPGRSHLAAHASILIMPDILRHLLYSMLIALHDYPSSPLPKRYDTEFLRLRDALNQDTKDAHAERHHIVDNNPRPNIVWMEGMLSLFEAPFPYDNEDRRTIGFGVGRQIIALYLIEIILKCAQNDLAILRRSRHNLASLFHHLSPQQKAHSETTYRELVNSNTEWDWDIAESVEALLNYLGKSAFTDTRYFWDPRRTHTAPDVSILVMPDTLRNLLYALFISLHNYPSEPITKRFDTTFRSLDDSLENERMTMRYS